MDKVKIRKKILKLRESFSEKERASKNMLIAKNLEALDIFKNAHHILFYYSVKGEADTQDLIKNHLTSKQLYLPVVRGKSNFQAVPVNRPLNLKAGFEGVPEPTGHDPSSVYDNQLEVIITPGVAFDKKGNRIGMGKGYYDRYFVKSSTAVKIALAYEEQVLDYVPKDKYDEPIDFIVTDQNIYHCNSKIAL